MDLILHILAGATVGFAIGLTGVGGGSLMTPILLLFQYPAPVAIGTDLLYAAITKSGGVIAHRRLGNIDWKIVAILASGSIPVSIFLNTLVLDKSFQQSEQYEKLLTLSLGIMLMVTAIVLIFRQTLRIKATTRPPIRFIAFIQKHRTVMTFVMGLILGAVVTLSSVGAGAFGAAVLLTLYARMPAVHIIGTDLAHAVPLTLIAGLGYLYHDFVDFKLLGSLLIGSLPAIYLGTKVGANLPETTMQRVLISVLLIMGLKYTFF